MSKIKCPLIKKPCIKHECHWYIQIQGTHPQTGQPVDQFDCTIPWLATLMIENSQMQRQTGAAVESFRNEMVESNESFIDLIRMSQTKQIGKSR